MTRPVVRLVRLTTGAHGTFGLLAVPGIDRPLACVECEWLDNRQNVSCVPPDRYLCVLTMSPRFGRKLYLLMDVPGRAGIRIHPCNLASQLRGCLGLGKSFGRFPGGEWGVFNSRAAVRMFEKAMGGHPFVLEIRHAA